MSLWSIKLSRAQGATVSFHAARSIVHEAMAIPDGRIGEVVGDVQWWEEQIIGSLEEGASTGEDITALGWARALCFLIARALRERCWVIMARQVWILRNEVRQVPVTVTTVTGESLVLQELEVPLWEVAFGGDAGWCRDWTMFCGDVLGISRAQARKLERVWQTYRIRLRLGEEMIERIGKSKAVTALSVVSEDLEVLDSGASPGAEMEQAEDDRPDSLGQLDGDLATILEEGTNRELQDYIRERRVEEGTFSGGRPRLAYEEETGRAVFWSSGKKPYPWAQGVGQVRVLPVPAELSEDDRRFWIRKREELAAVFGGELWV